MVLRRNWPGVLLLLLLSLSGNGSLVAAQQTRCAPKFSFFPKGGEDRNVPHAWGKTAQMAAGNYRDDALFNIVLTSTNNLPGIVAEAVPMLHIQPVHPLLSIGSTNLPASCTGFVPQQAGSDAWVNKGGAAAGSGQSNPAAADAGAAVDVAESAQIGGPSEAAPAAPVDETPVEPDAAAYAMHLAGLRAKQAAAAGETTAATTMDAATRQLLQSSASSSDIVNGSPIDWQENKDAEMQQQGRHLLAGEAVTVPASYRLQYSLNGSTPVDTGDISVMAMPFQRITLSGLKNYPDGYYCLTVKLTVVAGTGVMGGYISVPPFDLHSITQVCFYKLDSSPTGKVSFSSCSENFGVHFKDLGPQPIPLHPGSPQNLFSSVFHFNANLNRTKDWSWPSDATPKSMSHWLVMGAQDSVSKPQMWVPEEKVADGWYNLRLETSITSDFPTLLALNTMRAGVYAGANMPPELTEKPKYLATAQYKNGTVAGVQYVLTEFHQLTGPEEDLRLKVGDEMTFNWEFDGFGDMYCYNDGKLYNNMGDYNCNSPAQIRIPDRWNHTFRVALQDVCNQTFIVDAVYGTWGYKVLRAPAPRKRPIEETVNTGEKFELGAPASATLRAPKAATTHASISAGVSHGPLGLPMLGLCGLMALFAMWL